MINLQQSSTRGRSVTQNNTCVITGRFARTTAQNNGTIITGARLAPRVKRIGVKGKLRRDLKKYL